MPRAALAAASTAPARPSGLDTARRLARQPLIAARRFAETAGPGPLTLPLQARNAALDALFYDVGALSAEERALLLARTPLAGSILVVHPRGANGPVSIDRFADFQTFRDAPGALLRHFAMAGVGSSDMGAAALARTLADHVGAPVGAIVAGYGMADVMQEALGGWFFFGAANRALDLAQRLALLAPASPAATESAAGAELPFASPETLTLMAILGDPARTVETLVGHSKGCLEIAFALEALAAADPAAFARAAAIDIVTMGAVVATPPGLPKLRQYLGQIDSFGGLNSRPDVPRHVVPMAWHHLNTQLPNHMDGRKVLAGAFG
jgi:hypothetical protein